MARKPKSPKQVGVFKHEDAARRNIPTAEMESLWVPGVNQLGGFGRWYFAEFCDGALMKEDFDKLVDGLKEEG